MISAVSAVVWLGSVGMVHAICSCSISRIVLQQQERINKKLKSGWESLTFWYHTSGEMGFQGTQKWASTVDG